MKDRQCAGSEGMPTIPPAVCDILERAAHLERVQSEWTNRVQGADGTAA